MRQPLQAQTINQRARVRHRRKFGVGADSENDLGTGAGIYRRRRAGGSYAQVHTPAQEAVD